MQAFQYTRKVLDDARHGYGRSLTELVIPIPDSKEWLICNEELVCFTETPWNGYYWTLNPYETPKKRFEDSEEKHRQAAIRIEIPQDLYQTLYDMASCRKKLAALAIQAKNQNLETILGQSRFIHGKDLEISVQPDSPS
jgi:hypothetical protein